MTYDSLYGASFNSDGTLFAFGGADNRARILRVSDGKQVMRFDAHSDYVLGTTFSLKQDYLITVSRDMSMKLVTVANGQFVDNITSITPGDLEGGLVAVERHPTREEVLTGGADGEPKLYQNLPHQAPRHRGRLQPHPQLRGPARTDLQPPVQQGRQSLRRRGQHGHRRNGPHLQHRDRQPSCSTCPPSPARCTPSPSAPTVSKSPSPASRGKSACTTQVAARW